MKKLLLVIAVGTFVFACNNSPETGKDGIKTDSLESANSEANAAEDLQKMADSILPTPPDSNLKKNKDTAQ